MTIEYDVSTHQKAEQAWLRHRDRCFADDCKVCDRILSALFSKGDPS